MATKARIHDIRHGFAEALYASGVDLVKIQTLLGHRDLATTRRYVGRPRKAETREAANRGLAFYTGKGGES